MAGVETIGGLRKTDLVLLLLAAPGRGPGGGAGQLNGITRLEKLLFLAAREEGLSEFIKDPFEFRPYHYGPYSKEVYDSVDFLERIGLLAEERSQHGTALDEAEEANALVEDAEGVERRFTLTPKGAAVAKLLAERFSEASGILESIRKRYGAMTLSELIRYVYARHPDTTTHSRIREKG